eukprot:GSMAST32.ASY1.ANO1.82.1 assembled CDS
MSRLLPLLIVFVLSLECAQGGDVAGTTLQPRVPSEPGEPVQEAKEPSKRMVPEEFNGKGRLSNEFKQKFGLEGLKSCDRSKLLGDADTTTTLWGNYLRKLNRLSDEEFGVVCEIDYNKDSVKFYEMRINVNVATAYIHKTPRFYICNEYMNRKQIPVKIPASIGFLTDIIVLLVGRDCPLIGAIPPEVFKLSNLKYLSLSHNKLSGEIPEVSKLSNLEHLDLSFNELSGHIPSTISELQKLTVLKLTGNKLSGEIPEGITTLTNLKDLRIAHTNINGRYPEGFQKLTQLEKLDLAFNKISGDVIPSGIGNLEKLEELELMAYSEPIRENAITIPERKGDTNWREVMEAETLKSISLCNRYGRKLSGSIPSFFLQNLERLDLGGNNLTGLIPWKRLLEHDKMTLLRLSNNKLRGKLPEFGLHMKSLELLNLSHNQITGKFPNTLPIKLEVLDISHNNMSGTLPPTALQHNALESFVISHNHFYGPEPERIVGKDYRWYELDYPRAEVRELLEFEILYQSTESEFAKIKEYLKMIGLGECIEDIQNVKIKAFQTLKDLSPFYELDEDSINELKQSELKPLYELEKESMNELEKFCGHVDNNFLVIRKVARIVSHKRPLVLHLRGPDFEGKFPDIDQFNVDFTELLVENTKFTGEIPKSIGAMKSLVKISIANNELLYGVIPSEIGTLLNLEVLRINQDFRCEIPESLGNLDNLKILDLNDNRLQGQIPETMGKMHALKEFKMRTDFDPFFGFLHNPNPIGGEVPRGLYDKIQNGTLQIYVHRLHEQLFKLPNGVDSHEEINLKRVHSLEGDRCRARNVCEKCEECHLIKFYRPLSLPTYSFRYVKCGEEQYESKNAETAKNVLIIYTTPEADHNNVFSRLFTNEVECLQKNQFNYTLIGGGINNIINKLRELKTQKVMFDMVSINGHGTDSSLQISKHWSLKCKKEDLSMLKATHDTNQELFWGLLRDVVRVEADVIHTACQNASRSAERDVREALHLSSLSALQQELTELVPEPDAEKMTSLLVKGGIDYNEDFDISLMVRDVYLPGRKIYAMVACEMPRKDDVCLPYNEVAVPEKQSKSRPQELDFSYEDLDEDERRERIELDKEMMAQEAEDVIRNIAARRIYMSQGIPKCSKVIQTTKMGLCWSKPDKKDIVNCDLFTPIGIGRTYGNDELFQMLCFRVLREEEEKTESASKIVTLLNLMVEKQSFPKYIKFSVD